MKKLNNNRIVQSTIAAISLVAAAPSMAAANWGAATGPSAGAISGNIAASLVGVASGFEAVLYLLGIVFIVLFLLAAWKYKKSDGRDGSMGLIITYVILAACAMAAPTIMGSGIGTIFGSSAVTRVQAPTPNFIGQ